MVDVSKILEIRKSGVESATLDDINAFMALLQNI